MTDKLLLRPNEVAEALSVSRSKAYELIANKTLPSIELGGCIRVPADLLREWIAAEVRKLHGGPIT